MACLKDLIYFHKDISQKVTLKSDTYKTYVSLVYRFNEIILSWQHTNAREEIIKGKLPQEKPPMNE